MQLRLNLVKCTPKSDRDLGEKSVVLSRNITCRTSNFTALSCRKSILHSLHSFQLFPKQSTSYVVCFGRFISNMKRSLTRKGLCICSYISGLVCSSMSRVINLLFSGIGLLRDKIKEHFDVWYIGEDFVYNYANVARWMDRKFTVKV